MLPRLPPLKFTPPIRRELEGRRQAIMMGKAAMKQNRQGVRFCQVQQGTDRRQSQPFECCPPFAWLTC